MQYQVFVESQADHEFVASIVGMPDCIAQGTSKAEAISKAKTALTEKIARGELVTIEIEPPTNQPKVKLWVNTFGLFATDPTFDDFLKEITTYRQQVDNAAEETQA
jgi:predicted RNase H-like HicB family nuclease